jgi:hypothetical protein
MAQVVESTFLSMREALSSNSSTSKNGGGERFELSAKKEPVMQKSGWGMTRPRRGSSSCKGFRWGQACLFFGGTRVWTQGFKLIRQVLNHLSQSPSPLYFSLFLDRVSHFHPGRPWTMILHYRSALPCLSPRLPPQACLFRRQGVSETWVKARVALVDVRKTGRGGPHRVLKPH